MGLITRLLSFTRVTRKAAQTSDVKVTTGYGAPLTAQHFAPPGDDSHPLPSDYVLAIDLQQRGRVAAIGYVDPNSTPAAQAGDKRTYARNGSGAPVVSLWLKNDGSAVLANGAGSVTLTPAGAIIGSNSSGSFELQAGGDFVVNGVTIAADGSVTIPASLTLAGKEIAAHTHSQGPDSDGNTQQTTSGNL